MRNTHFTREEFDLSEGRSLNLLKLPEGPIVIFGADTHAVKTLMYRRHFFLSKEVYFAEATDFIPNTPLIGKKVLHIDEAINDPKCTIVIGLCPRRREKILYIQERKRRWYDLFDHIALEQQPNKQILDFHRAVKMKNGHFLDVGSNVGRIVYYFSNFFELITSCEPVPETLDLQKRKLIEYDNIIYENIALSEINGNLTMYVDQYTPERTSSTLSEYLIDKSASDYAEIKVKSETLDFVIGRLSSPPDLIKIDAEGHDYNVLKSGLDSILHFKPHIIFEASKISDHAQKTEILETFAKLTPYFDIYELYTFSRLTCYDQGVIFDPEAITNETVNIGLIPK